MESFGIYLFEALGRNPIISLADLIPDEHLPFVVEMVQERAEIQTVHNLFPGWGV